MPAGADPNAISLYFLGGSVFLAFMLSFLSKNLSLWGLSRWGLLAGLTWVVGAVGMVIESAFFMDTGAVGSTGQTLFTLLNFLLPSILLAGGVSWLFPSADTKTAALEDKSPQVWGGNLLLALLAYPVVYITYGLIVEPWVSSYYAAGLFELALPTWGQLIPLQIARSILFLIVCLPIIINWQGTKKGLWLSLGGSFFGLTAFMAVITAYWFPWELRLYHGLELLADAFTYIGILVWLYVPGSKQA